MTKAPHRRVYWVSPWPSQQGTGQQAGRHGARAVAESLYPHPEAGCGGGAGKPGRGIGF